MKESSGQKGNLGGRNPSTRLNKEELLKAFNLDRDVNGKVLVDLTVDEPAHYFISLITSKGLQYIYNSMVSVVVSDYVNEKGIELIRDFSIDSVINYSRFNLPVGKKILCAIEAFFIFVRNGKRDRVLGAKYRGMVIGSYVYDFYLAKFKKSTLHSYDVKLYMTIVYALITYRKFERIFAENEYKCYMVSELQGVIGGVSAAIAIKNNVPVLTRKFALGRVLYKQYTRLSELSVWNGHPNKKLFNELMQERMSEALAWSNNYLENLMRGDVANWDWNAKNAYTNAKYVTGRDFDSYLPRLHKNNKKVLIMSHVFTDAPHCYWDGLYCDYFEWLKETLLICKQRKDVLWIVKSHPSEQAYEMDVRVADLLDDFSGDDNICLLSENISTLSIYSSLDAIITVRGTAAVEYSCLGVPTIIAGDSPFDDAGFVIKPSSKKEYEQILLGSVFDTRLSADQIRNAKVLLYLYQYYDRIDLPLLSTRETNVSDVGSNDQGWIDLSEHVNSMLDKGGDQLYSMVEKYYQDLRGKMSSLNANM